MIEPKRFTLYEVQKVGPAKYKKYFLIVLAIVGVIWLIDFIYSSIVLDAHPDPSLVYVFVIMPIILILDSYLREKLFISFYENKITFRSGYIKRTKTISDSEMKRIKVKITDIIIYTKNGKEYSIDIGNAEFSDIEKIKHHILKFQTQYNIAI